VILYALLLLPALGALGAYVHHAVAYRTVWLVAVATLHLGLVAECWRARPDAALGGWLAIDALGLLILSVVSVVFLVIATYAVGYLRVENPRGGRAFVSCLLAFLAAATLVALSHHIGLMWVGMESMTLSVAPLIFHRHDRRSLEAVWKYLLLSSLGIALALLGTFFLATAQSSGVGNARPLVLEDLLATATHLHPAWLRAAFVFLLVGFGTKMGLAPLHGWKPDTYGEAPSLVGGLMASALTACAFLGVARIVQVVSAAGMASFARPPLIAFGLISMTIATVYIVGQRDLKRMLAYSSIEHMGLLVLGLGLGGVGVYGTVLHVINNAVTKTLVFLAAGNIVLAKGTSTASDIRGLIRTLPVSGTLLFLGTFAITGSPPFGPFVSMFTILSAASDGHPWITVTMVLLLTIVFVGLAVMVLGMLLGEPAPASRGPAAPRSVWLVGGPIALAALSLMLGLYLPPPLRRVLAEAAASLGGQVP
jgi:hydrogenase-4 component F